MSFYFQQLNNQIFTEKKKIKQSNPRQINVIFWCDITAKGQSHATVRVIIQQWVDREKDKPRHI